LKKIIIIKNLHLAILSFMFLHANVSFSYSMNQDPPASILNVVIDAGHGGKDEGCMGKNSMEKHITLSIAKKLGQKIKSRFSDVNIIYTRESDVFIPLDKRAEMANQAKGDVFISIHCNALRQKEIHGAEVYVMGESPASDNITQLNQCENDAVRLEENYTSKYGGYKHSATGYEAKSMNFARKLQRQFRTLGRKTLGIKEEPFVVLRMTYMPGVLIESGFLTNSKEEDYLLSNTGQEQVAEAISKAFTDYKMENDVQVESISRVHQPRVIYRPALRPIQTVITRTDVPKTQVTDALRDELSIDANYSPETDMQRSRRMTYKVELGVTMEPVNESTPLWGEVYHLETEQVGNAYKHYASGYPDYSAAMKGLMYWRGRGFQSAFLVTYKDGQRVN